MQDQPGLHVTLEKNNDLYPGNLAPETAPYSTPIQPIEWGAGNEELLKPTRVNGQVEYFLKTILWDSAWPPNFHVDKKTLNS